MSFKVSKCTVNQSNVTAPSLPGSSSRAASWNVSLMDLLCYSIDTHLLYLLLSVLLPILHHIQHYLLLQTTPNIHIPLSSLITPSIPHLCNRRLCARINCNTFLKYCTKHKNTKLHTQCMHEIRFRHVCIILSCFILLFMIVSTCIITKNPHTEYKCKLFSIACRLHQLPPHCWPSPQQCR